MKSYEISSYFNADIWCLGGLNTPKCTYTSLCSATTTSVIISGLLYLRFCSCTLSTLKTSRFSTALLNSISVA